MNLQTVVRGEEVKIDQEETKEQCSSDSRNYRKLETIVTKDSNGNTHTCVLTEKAYLLGGTNDDNFIDAVVDSSGYMYATGSSYSPAFTNGE